MQAILHIPKPLPVNSDRPSEIRPLRMLDAFNAIGCQVHLVAGESTERKRAAHALERRIRNGEHFDFCYAETANRPLALSDSDGVPRHPLFDYRLLQRIRAAGIPIGLFIRDLYWRFDFYRDMLPPLARNLALPLYYLDFMVYRRYADHIFLPSTRMAEYFPRPVAETRRSALPPGIDTGQGVRLSNDPAGQGLRCLYVGGATPPFYDLSDVLAYFGNSTHTLTIVCRAAEWQAIAGHYANLLTERIRIVHAGQDQLPELYGSADLALLVRAPNAYLDFAMPFKLLEAVQFAVPVVVSGNNAASEFVSNNQLGWTIPDVGALAAQLDELAAKRQLIREMSSHCVAAFHENSWAARARTVVETLLGSGR